MPATEPFELFDPTFAPDADLRLVLAECHPGESSPWKVPAYTFRMQGARCVGVIDVPPEYPLEAGVERQKTCFRLGLPQ